MNTLFRLALPVALFSSFLPACAADQDEEWVDDAEAELDQSWKISDSIYKGRAINEALAKGERRIHPVYVNASKAYPVTLSLAVEGGPAVRAALLSPLSAGKRTTVASDGYGVRKSKVALSTRLEAPGVYLLSVSGPNLSAVTGVRVLLSTKAGVSALDPVKSPLARSEGGAESTGVVQKRALSLKLGAGLEGASVSLFAQPPRATLAERNARRNLGTAVVKSGAAAFTIPADVAEGDDLVVRVADYDSEVPLRIWTKAADGIRVDRLRTPNATDLQFSGANGSWFEGYLDLSLVLVNPTTHAATNVVSTGFPNFVFPAGEDFTNVRYRIDGTFKTPAGLVVGKTYGIASTPMEGSFEPFTCFTLTAPGTFKTASCK